MRDKADNTGILPAQPADDRKLEADIVHVMGRYFANGAGREGSGIEDAIRRCVKRYFEAGPPGRR